MTNKERYIAWAAKQEYMPIFMQPWWMDAVCAGKEWDVLLAEDEQGEIIGAMPYLLRKLLLGAAVGGLCYALFPLFPALSPVFAARDQVLSRTLSLGALALSSALSAGFLFLLSLMAGGKRAKN